MNILFYSPVKLLSGGGCERWHCDVTAAIKKYPGNNVQIVTANLGKNQWTQEYLEKQLQVPYQTIEFPIFFGALVPTPKAFLSLLNYFKQADVIHIIQGFIGQDIFILLLKYISGKKVIVGHHAPIFHKSKLHNFYMQYVSRFLFNFFDGHMTLNSSDKTFLETKWKVRNVHFIPSGIQVERFLKIKRHKHAELNFITTGIYRPQKGMDLLVQAIARFNKEYPKNEAVFRFVGGGEQKNLITEYAKQNKNIIDAGYVQYEEIPKLYEKSDVYLLSSREEPFGLVLIEGWSSGIPALATKTEGPRDMLVPNKNGWFIAEISVNGIYEAIVKIYKQWEKSPSFLATMEDSSRKTGQQYSIIKTAERMNRLFGNTIKS